MADRSEVENDPRAEEHGPQNNQVTIKVIKHVSHTYLRTKSLLGVKIQEKGKKTKRPRGEEGAQEKRWRLSFSP